MSTQDRRLLLSAGGEIVEEFGGNVLIADAAKVRGLAPLACKTDRIDARVLAVSPTKLCGYTGPCPKVKQSGNTHRRGPISKARTALPALGALRGRAARLHVAK